MTKYFFTTLLTVGFLCSNVFALTPDQELEKNLQRKIQQQFLDRDPHAEEYEEMEEEEYDTENVQSFSRSLQQITSQQPSAQQPSKLVDEMQAHMQSNQAASQGEQDPWDIKRAELENYVLDSYWITWKMKSAGDAQLTVSGIRLGFLPVQIAAEIFGMKGITDKLEDFIIERIYKNKGKLNDPISKEHRVDVLYVKVQHNAFNLLFITKDDYFNLIKKYPEVAYLFEDLYTFFKWRAHLHQYYKSPILDITAEDDLSQYLTEPNDYRYNDYFIYEVFKKPVKRNSFEAWHELANIAKQEMMQAVQAQATCLSTKTAEQEEASIRKYVFNAHNALEAGRIWNGLQRYAVQKHALPLMLNPTLGAGEKTIREKIKADTKGDSKQRIKQKFTDYRLTYLAGRDATEPVWQAAYQTNHMDHYKCAAPEGQKVTPKRRADPIADDLSMLDELAEALTKKALEL